MAITTRLTERLGIAHPVILAPMALAAGGRLAAAVSHAGGLGLIGGGYGDATWLESELGAAGNARIGCGFITWSLRKQPALLDQVLARKPAAVFLSFDDPEPFASQVRRSGAKLICQVQTVGQARQVIEAGADVVVAQGSEAGGHGGQRGTLPLVAEIADLMHRTAPETLLCAAGGIADGRGLAAALMLGADGVVVGTRFWAAAEALVHSNLHAAAVVATGDATIRTRVTDIARGLEWPQPYTIRVLRNAFTDRWHGRESEMTSEASDIGAAYARAVTAGDAQMATPIVGEAIGLVGAVEPARVILERMVAEAQVRLRSASQFVS